MVERMAEKQERLDKSEAIKVLHTVQHLMRNKPKVAEVAQATLSLAVILEHILKGNVD